MSQVLPILLESVFEKIRTNNAFTIDAGEIVWSLPNWHDPEMEPFDLARVVWNTGSGRLALSGTDWTVTVDSGEEPAPGTEFQFEHPFYEFGSIAEVVDIVKGEFGIKKNTAFPLALAATIDTGYEPVYRGTDLLEYSFKLFLCVKTEKSMLPKERYQKSYQERLIPLWGLIRRYIIYASILIPEEEYFFRERWGENGIYDERKNNVFGEMVDALEIDLSLLFNSNTKNNGNCM